MPGPMPERSDMVRRRNKPDVEIVQSENHDVVEWPEPAPGWHVLVQNWYKSLSTPALAPFFTQADVAQAAVVAQMASDQLSQPKGASAAAIGPIVSAMSEFLTTEASRRRLRIELTRADTQEEAPVLDIVDRRKRLASGD